MRSLMDKKVQKKELSSPTSHSIFLLITPLMGYQRKNTRFYVRR